MKKVLLATTALAMTAGVAHADITLTGNAEIGIWDNGTALQFHHDVDVTFNMSGETDNGLSYGAAIDIDEVANGVSNQKGGHVVFVQGAFGTITMGDTDGAFDKALSEVDILGSLGDDHTVHPGFNGNSGLDGGFDDQVARYDYSFQDFTFSLSLEADDTGAKDPIWGLGVAYSGDLGGVTLGVGVGVQSGHYNAPAVAPIPSGTSASGDADLWGLSVTAAFSGFQAKLNYSSLDGTLTSSTTTSTIVLVPGFSPSLTATTTTAISTSIDWEHYGLSLGYSMDAIGVEVNYGHYDGNVGGTPAGDFSAEGYGVAFNYKLSDAAIVQVGYGHGDNFAFTGTVPTTSETWSAGLRFNF